MNIQDIKNLKLQAEQEINQIVKDFMVITGCDVTDIINNAVNMSTMCGRIYNVRYELEVKI